MITGSNEWWTVVQSTKFSEAETMLREYKAKLMSEFLGTERQVFSDSIMNRINAEIHRISQLSNKVTLRSVMRDMLDTETFEAICTEAARREQELM